MGKYLDIPARFITESYTDSVMKPDKTVGNVQPEEEVYEECDMFIELGDEMYYVSEYHNALFDDPDAHDEALNEFGILLDSYDDEIVQEVASYGPYDEYLKKHGYDPKTNTIKDPVRPRKRISAGRIGSEKERRRMNRFLHENGYDPKTETIQTDINDVNNPGSKLRVKFNIMTNTGPGESQSRYMGNPDDYVISMDKPAMQAKLHNSTGTLKHEEGHLNSGYGTYYGKPTSEDIEREKDTKKYFDKIDSSGKLEGLDLHASFSDEYDHDAYSVTHNRHDKRGTSIGSTLKSMIHDIAKYDLKRAKNRSKSIRQSLSESINIVKSAGLLEILLQQNTPTENDDDLTWAKFLAKKSKNNSMFNKFMTDDANSEKIMKQYQLIEDQFYKNPHKRYTPEHKKYSDEINKKLTEIERQLAEVSERIHNNPAVKIIAAAKNVITKKNAGFIKPDGTIDRAKISGDRHKKSVNDAFLREADLRQTFAKDQFDKKQKALKAEQAKKRQLSKEELQKQLDSGKLSKEQAAKASKKIARIQQFEERQGKAPQQPKKSAKKK